MQGLLQLTLTGWADIANVALAILALLALIGAAIQIHLTRSASRQALTYGYTERLSAPELLPHHQKTAELFSLNGTATHAERYAAFQEWSYGEKLAALGAVELMLGDMGLAPKGPERVL